MKRRLLVTMGDVAGIGPEIIARAWPELIKIGRPVVVGDPGWLHRGLQLARGTAAIRVIERIEEAEPGVGEIPVLAASGVDLQGVQTGQVSAAAGRAAYDYLCRAIDLALAKEADAIVTCPLHKEGLHLAGIAHPGHTEILAERTGTSEFAMMLYARGPELPQGLAVLHVTLHCALREIFARITTAAVEEKIRLLDGILTRMLGRRPRIGVAGLNPHASDGGLFGNEEESIIGPAVKWGQSQKICVSGPWPSDTLFVRARAGEFDGLVVMYHDQGHIAMKTLGGWNAVNVSVGLPIVRTSVAHGTAYNIAGKGVADPVSLIEAARVAVMLCQGEA
jgi:4-hydroxythreonine-4-phosphate dehydrogenase